MCLFVCLFVSSIVFNVVLLYFILQKDVSSDAWILDAWILDASTLGLWTLGVWTTGRLDSGRLDARTPDTWTLDAWTLRLWTLRLWMPGLLTTGRLHSGRLDARTLDAWTLDDWTLGLWTPGLWTLAPRQFYQFLVTLISFLLLFTVELLSIPNALRLICYGSVEIVMNSCYNSNLRKVQLFIKRKLTLESLKQVIYFLQKQTVRFLRHNLDISRKYIKV